MVTDVDLFVLTFSCQKIGSELMGGVRCIDWV
jgi:hypothetical protein